MRRQSVASLVADKLTQLEIANRLGVSQQTISTDITHLRKQWDMQAQACLSEFIARELAELREMERTCAEQLNKTLDPRWMAERIKIKTRIAKMLGLDTPTQNDSDVNIVVRYESNGQ